MPPIETEDRRQPNITQTRLAERLQQMQRRRPLHPRCLPSTTPLSMLHKPNILPVSNHTVIVKKRFGEGRSLSFSVHLNYPQFPNRDIEGDNT